MIEGAAVVGGKTYERTANQNEIYAMDKTNSKPFRYKYSGLLHNLPTLLLLVGRVVIVQQHIIHSRHGGS